MAPHPDVFVSVAHEEGERVDDRFTVADEHRARASLQHAVSEQRDERRNENEVVGARRPDALHRLVRDFRRRIVKERNEQPPESRVGDVPDRDGDVAPRLSIGVARICCQVQQHALCSVHVGRRRASGKSDCGRRANPRIVVDQQGPGQRRGVCLVDRRERAHRRGPDPRVRVSQRPSNLGDPLLGHLGVDRAKRVERPRPHRRRLVIEEERRHEVALVQRLEDIDRVHDPCRLRMGQFLNERFDGGQIAAAQADFGRREVAPLDALPEGLQVAAPGAQRHHDPQGRHDQARVAQLLPVQIQAPRFHQEQQEKRAQRLRSAIDGHVHEGLRLQLDVCRERQEEDLPRRLVDGVTEGLVEHAGQARRPQSRIEQHDRTAGAEADGQNHQREADSQITVNLARQPDLNDEADDRRPELDVGQEHRNGIG